ERSQKIDLDDPHRAFRHPSQGCLLGDIGTHRLHQRKRRMGRNDPNRFQKGRRQKKFSRTIYHMIKSLVLTGCAFVLAVFASQAQDSFDPDALLLEARGLILDDKYVEGRKIAFRALDKYPNYADILIL